MKKLSIFLTLIFLSAVLFAQDITKSHQVAAFTGVNAGGVFDITLTKSPTNSVTTTAGADIAKYIQVKVKDGVLHLDLDSDNMPASLKRNIKYIKANITINQLDKLFISGAARLKSNGQFNPTSFKGDFSGAVIVEGLNIVSGSSFIQVSGASKLDIKGRADAVKYDISGASVVTIDQESGDLEIGGSGASKMNYSGNSSKTEVSISGATNVKMRGSSSLAVFEASGASVLDAEHFNVKEAEIEASGVSNIRSNVTGSLSAELSGGSVLLYSGNPVMKKVQTSSQASIKRLKP